MPHVLYNQQWGCLEWMAKYMGAISEFWVESSDRFRNCI
jgi:hypothetical protein